KFAEQRSVPARREMLEKDMITYKNIILSGAVCGWGDDFKHYFDLVIFLWIPQHIRMKRLEQREFQRYGKEIVAGGNKHELSKKFLEWASLYDHAGLEVRSKTLHENWMAELSCPILRIEGNYSVEERVEIVMDYLSTK